MLRAMIIDDEILSIKLIEHLLKEIGGVHIAATFHDPVKGLESAMQLKPDIVFLDIQMSAKNGLDVAKELSRLPLNADIVFITAYDHFALEAFGVRATDYILKPVDPGRLRTTIDIIKTRRASASPTETDAAEKALKAQFLGTFILFNDEDRPIKWRTKKVKELCAYLLHNNLPVYRGQIIEDLWPGHDMNRALHYLHIGIYQIRKTLKDNGLGNAVYFANDCYSLNLRVASDIERLKKLCETAGNGEEQMEALLRCYSCDYLEREDYWWSLNYREELYTVFKTRLEQYVKTWESSPGPVPTLLHTCLETLIRLEPFREDYVVKAIRRLLEGGRKQEAASLYRQFTERLWQELKELPGDALTRLGMEIGLDSPFMNQA